MVMLPKYTIARVPPSATELGRLYQDAGWIASPDLERMQHVVDHESEWFVARNENQALLGLGRIITDYIRYAFIVDVIVENPFRGAGIGSAIVESMLTECKAIGIDSVNLWPSKGLVPFYERFGFYSLPSDQPHMKWGGS